MSGQRKANNQRTAHPTAHQGGKQIEIEHMGTETPKEYVGDSITTETCFHMNHHKRVRMYICAPKARNNQHIFNFNHIQLEEGIRKQQATEKKETRRREESIPLHTPRLQKRNEAIRTTRTTHETIRWIRALREKENKGPKGPRHIYDESERHDGR